MMRRDGDRLAMLAPVLTVLICSSSLAPARPQNRGYGPEVRSFLSFLKQEEAELNYQIKHKEISRPDYVRSKNRIAILRQTVLDRVQKTREDHVPEYHVVTATELDSLIPDGIASIKSANPGDTVAGKWRYVGSVTRGEQFFIVERVAEN